MRSFFGQAFGKSKNFTGSSKEELAYRVLPNFLLTLIKRYLRVHTEGLRHIPKEGPCIIIANHSGYMGFDALMLAHQIFQETGRIPRIIAHKLWFFQPEISVHVKKLGMIPASFESGLKILERGEILLLFPEGEEGNFKPSRLRYRLRRFRRGFLRLALASGAPIIPATVLGAEETHITLSQIRWAKPLLGIIIPIPLNVIPIPVKWRLRFFAPQRVKKDLAKSQNMTFVTQESRKYRADLQKKIHNQLKRRDNLFI